MQGLDLGFKMDAQDKQCGFVGQYFGRCADPSLMNSRYCFWHDPDVGKTSTGVRTLLETRARSGIPMEGFQLRRANLGNIDLVNHDGEPYRLVGSDLSRANLSRAHLYRVDFSGSNLMKADLSQANLHHGCLSRCNLLGSNLKGTRIEHVDWGDRFLQEEKAGEALQKGQEKEAVMWYQEAEEVSRNIRKSCESQGLFAIAGNFFYREVVFRRYRYHRWSWARFISKMVDLISGYGEKPLRVVGFSMVLIFFCSLFYFLFGVLDGGQLVKFEAGQPISSNLLNWLDTLYFSVVTFTTLGYGDLTPVGLSRVIAAVEAFTGSFTLALFVVVFVKKMTR